MINLEDDKELIQLKKKNAEWRIESEARMEKSFKEAMESTKQVDESFDRFDKAIDKHFDNIGKSIDKTKKCIQGVMITYIIAVIIIIVCMIA